MKLGPIKTSPASSPNKEDFSGSHMSGLTASQAKELSTKEGAHIIIALVTVAIANSF